MDITNNEERMGEIEIRVIEEDRRDGGRKGMTAREVETKFPIMARVEILMDTGGGTTIPITIENANGCRTGKEKEHGMTRYRDGEMVLIRVAVTLLI